MSKFHDLDFKALPDGSIRLTQSDCGEDSFVDLHPEQILFIARRLCGMKPETAEKVIDLERRIAVLTDKLQKIVCNGAFRSDVIEGIGEGFEYLAKLDGLLDLAMEFDGGRLEPEYRDGEQEECHSASKPTHPLYAIDQGKKTQPSATVQARGQLGLAV